MQTDKYTYIKLSLSTPSFIERKCSNHVPICRDVGIISRFPNIKHRGGLHEDCFEKSLNVFYKMFVIKDEKSRNQLFLGYFKKMRGELRRYVFVVVFFLMEWKFLNRIKSDEVDSNLLSFCSYRCTFIGFCNY